MAMRIRKVALAILTMGMLASMNVCDAEGATPLRAPHYTMDKATVIRGAEYFGQNCLSCHSVKYLRYINLMKGLGMTQKELTEYVMRPDGANVHAGMIVTMTHKEASKFFGKPPPDLSQIERYLGPDFIYTYLTSFYLDNSRPTGWNNHVFPSVAMPNVLAPYGGQYLKDGKLYRKGSMTPEQYKTMVSDIVAFLRYASDPSVLERHDIGPYVVGGFGLATVVGFIIAIL
ncbi:cytochrome c1 [Acidihalobacter prosperus]|uniref:Ubiquinol cytochrome C oxidoreductase, cytochrome C1 subunit n=1 Tax=Acidihalobacter prosperus TaxID=160660 RepID=A0A1A6C3T3_9GAMM|nr:cytochrome c1 [Acidihalobacter prosperus]OBS09221.1 ubiquinol cytochrome C oxidoreductase, cytochrome C1 subunit [Acidihalobacter prosperus]